MLFSLEINLKERFEKTTELEKLEDAGIRGARGHTSPKKKMIEKGRFQGKQR